LHFHKPHFRKLFTNRIQLFRKCAKVLFEYCFMISHQCSFQLKLYCAPKFRILDENTNWFILVPLHTFHAAFWSLESCTVLPSAVQYSSCFLVRYLCLNLCLKVAKWTLCILSLKIRINLNIKFTHLCFGEIFSYFLGVVMTNYKYCSDYLLLSVIIKELYAYSSQNKKIN